MTWFAVPSTAAQHLRAGCDVCYCKEGSEVRLCRGKPIKCNSALINSQHRMGPKAVSKWVSV